MKIVRQIIFEGIQGQLEAKTNFLSQFISILTALIVKKSHILTGIFFIFLRKRSRPNLKSFKYHLSFRLNCVKGLRITEVVKQI